MTVSTSGWCENQINQYMQSTYSSPQQAPVSCPFYPTLVRDTINFWNDFPMHDVFLIIQAVLCSLPSISSRSQAGLQRTEGWFEGVLAGHMREAVGFCSHGWRRDGSYPWDTGTYLRKMVKCVRWVEGDWKHRDFGVDSIRGPCQSPGPLWELV